jgi:glutathione S-transferase
MILIGQYDSPFVRRVAIALRLYRIGYEHRPWSTFGDADRIASFNPLRRVPTLILDNGEVLVESGAILDHLDESVGPSRAMIAEAGDMRRHALKICALATGLADKAVSLVYERLLHQTTSDPWIARCRAQIADVLAALESDKAARSVSGSGLAM